MFQYSNKNISIASYTDINRIKDLLNNAYRGEASKQGWTTEANIIAGDTRTDDNMLKEVMKTPGSVILIYKNDDELITGCVNLQQHGDKIYLGMFSVSPKLQGKGIGKHLLFAAEEYASHAQCRAIYMSVISVRTEIINWYKRHGYIDTGERKPFIEDDVTGKHLQVLEFMTMEKQLLK